MCNTTLKMHSHLGVKDSSILSPEASHLGPKPIYHYDFMLKFNIHLILNNHPFNVGVPHKMPPRSSLNTNLTLGVNAP
jgi:hypothetical protein